MARYTCPQCGRGFGSVGDMLTHTQEDHADDQPYDAGAEPTITSRSMPSAEPGPVATERASGTDFEVEPATGNGSGASRPAPKPKDEDADQQQNPTLGTLIALIVIAAIIILNIIGGAGE